MDDKMVPRILAKLARTGPSKNTQEMGIQASALAYKDSLLKKQKESMERDIGERIHSSKQLGFHSGTPSQAKQRNVPTVKSLNLAQTKKRLMSSGKWGSSKKPKAVNLKAYEPNKTGIIGKNPATQIYLMQKSDIKNKIHRSFSGKIRTES